MIWFKDAVKSTASIDGEFLFHDPGSPTAPLVDTNGTPTFPDDDIFLGPVEEPQLAVRQQRGSRLLRRHRDLPRRLRTERFRRRALSQSAPVDALRRVARTPATRAASRGAGRVRGGPTGRRSACAAPPRHSAASLTRALRSPRTRSSAAACRPISRNMRRPPSTVRPTPVGVSNFSERGARGRGSCRGPAVVASAGPRRTGTCTPARTGSAARRPSRSGTRT